MAPNEKQIKQFCLVRKFCRLFSSNKKGRFSVKNKHLIYKFQRFISINMHKCKQNIFTNKIKIRFFIKKKKIRAERIFLVAVPGIEPEFQE